MVIQKITPKNKIMDQSIFDTLEPIREKELKGIQLTENLNPKPKKKKKARPSDEVSNDNTGQSETSPSENGTGNQNKEPE